MVICRASYMICEDRAKWKCGPLVQKAGKRPFLPSTVFLLTCHGIFYLLFNVMFPWAWGYSQSRTGAWPPSCDMPCFFCACAQVPVRSGQRCPSLADGWDKPRTHSGEVGRWQETRHCMILGSTPLARFIVPWLWLIKRKLKDKIIENFNPTTTEHETQVWGPLLSVESCATILVVCMWSPGHVT